MQSDSSQVFPKAGILFKWIELKLKQAKNEVKTEFMVKEINADGTISDKVLIFRKSTN